MERQNMELREDDTRTGEPEPIGRRSAARQAMDQHADTGVWMACDVPSENLDAVRRRLYTLANKAGYGLRTETAPGGDEGVTTLRMLVRSRIARRGAA